MIFTFDKSTGMIPSEMYNRENCRNFTIEYMHHKNKKLDKISRKGPNPFYVAYTLLLANLKCAYQLDFEQFPEALKFYRENPILKVYDEMSNKAFLYKFAPRSEYSFDFDLELIKTNVR